MHRVASLPGKELDDAKPLPCARMVKGNVDTVTLT
jgi:hypothetical protein